MSTPLDEFLEYEKNAGLGDFLRGVGRGVTSLGGAAAPRQLDMMGRGAVDAFSRGSQLGQEFQSGAALALGGAAITGIGLAAKKISDAVAKRREFREMMDLDPELREHQAKDPKIFNAAYSSLRSLNPAFGRDPLVAGAHMKQFMDNPDTAGLMVARTVRPPDAPRPDSSGFSVEFGAGPIPLSYKRSF